MDPIPQPVKYFVIPVVEKAYPRSVIKRAAAETMERWDNSVFLATLDAEMQKAESAGTFVRIPDTHAVFELDGVTVFGNPDKVSAVHERLQGAPAATFEINAIDTVRGSDAIDDRVLNKLRFGNAAASNKIAFWFGAISTVATWAAMCLCERDAQAVLARTAEHIKGTEDVVKRLDEGNPR